MQCSSLKTGFTNCFYTSYNLFLYQVKWVLLCPLYSTQVVLTYKTLIHKKTFTQYIAVIIFLFRELASTLLQYVSYCSQNMLCFYLLWLQMMANLFWFRSIEKIFNTESRTLKNINIHICIYKILFLEYQFLCYYICKILKSLCWYKTVTKGTRCQCLEKCVHSKYIQ